MKLIIENKTLISIENVTAEETHLTIPAEIEHIAANACKNSKFQKITISEGVETIEEQAFSSCPNLDTVIIPSTCKKLGEKAFYDCKALENVFLNADDCVISSDTFSVNRSQGYDDFAFLLSEPRREYNLDENFPVTFHLVPTCSWETMVQLVEASDIYFWKRGYGARDNTYDVFMYGFHHGETLEKIGKRNILIHNENILDSSVLPDKKARFCDLFGEYYLKLNSGNEQHLIVNYVKISNEISMKRIDDMIERRSINHRNLIEKIDGLIAKLEVEITAGVEAESDAKIDLSANKEINKKPFSSKGVLKENTLFIPYGVITIEKDDYVDYADATRIVFPDTVMVIPDDAFSTFTKLKSIEFSGKPLYISENAFGKTVFHYCTKKILNSYFDEDARFYVEENKKKNLDNLCLNSVWEMGDVQIESVIKRSIDEITYFYNTKTQSIVLCSCDNTLVETVRIPESINGRLITRIGAGAFSGLKHIKNVEVPSAVQSIGWRAFAGCVLLQNIYVHSDEVTIDNEVFHNCESLQYIQFKFIPNLPSKHVPSKRWANWLNDGYQGKYWYDPSHDSDQYHEYSGCEMLEKVMFSAPFPKIHIEQMSAMDIYGMHSYSTLEAGYYSPEYIIFEEQTQEQSDE